jgi:hypothetical protein
MNRSVTIHITPALAKPSLKAATYSRIVSGNAPLRKPITENHTANKNGELAPPHVPLQKTTLIALKDNTLGRSLAVA